MKSYENCRSEGVLNGLPRRAGQRFPFHILCSALLAQSCFPQRASGSGGPPAQEVYVSRASDETSMGNRCLPMIVEETDRVYQPLGLRFAERDLRADTNIFVRGARMALVWGGARSTGP